MAYERILKVPYHQHIQWTQDWLRDHYRLEHNQTLIPTPVDSIRGIIQQTSEKLIHIIMYKTHLAESPEVILFIYVVNLA